MSIPSDTTGLSELQSAEKLQLLDAIDKLRTLGVNQSVPLPQLVVCGDQSAGKSSLLDAITQIPFPRDSSLCTRFATEIVLRRSPSEKATVEIVPNRSSRLGPPSNSETSAFKRDLQDLSEVSDIIKMASKAMGIGRDSTQNFSRDRLKVEISGPQQPHLTVVDLPGLIHTNTEEGGSDVELVREIVDEYICNERSIILAVVSAANDYQNQIVLSRAKQVDPRGLRTLGVITKPDMLPVDSSSQDAFHALAENRSIKFTLGWHVVRNRSYEERDLPASERDKLEETFFSKGVWATLKRDSVGVSSLRTRLSELLYLHIKRELPKVVKEVEKELEECKEQLQALGESRGTIKEMREFLSRLASSFGEICKASVKGFYEEEFFGEGVRITPKERTKRLRAVVQKQNRQFEETLRTRGHLKEILPQSFMPMEYPAESPEPSGSNLPHKITYSQALRWVRPLVENGQGRELPGTFNPLLIGNLFWEQSRKWPGFGETHLEYVFSSCQKFVHLLVGHFANTEVSANLFHRWLNAQLKERKQHAKEELQRLHVARRQHPITYNHYFTDLVQRSRAEDEHARQKKAILASTGGRYSTWKHMPNDVKVNKESLLRKLDSRVVVDMDQWACEEVLRHMLAYYKVALKTYVDNVTTQVVERHLLSELHEIFTPLTVMAMSDKVVRDIAGESDASKSLRKYLVDRRDGLEKGLELCLNAMPEADIGGSEDGGNGEEENGGNCEEESGGNSEEESGGNSEEESGGEREGTFEMDPEADSHFEPAEYVSNGEEEW